jgi:hypothetical protein
MAQNQKCEQLLKRNRRDHQQINRSDPFHMIAQEGVPGLQWSVWPRHHVDRHCRLGDRDAELEQLAMDLGGATKWVLKAHSSDRSRTSLAIRGRPRGARDFQRQ